MSRKINQALVLSSLLFALAPGLSGGEPTDKPDAGPEITIRVYDLAKIPHRTWKRGGEKVVRILGKAGVRAVWLNCTSPEPPEIDVCQRPREATDFTLRIILGTKANRPHTCGEALRPSDGGNGSFLTVFYGCVSELSRREGVDTWVVLAHVAAHEVGHLLLPSGKHTRQGIMRARLTSRELQAADLGRLVFTPKQASQIQTAVRARVALQVMANLAEVNALL